MNLVACREVAKHSWCLQCTGASITPDGVIVLTGGEGAAAAAAAAGTAAADAHPQEEATRPASLSTQMIRVGSVASSPRFSAMCYRG